MFNFSLPRFISLAVVVLVAFPIHELAHALAADYFGDDTPRMQGRITLNPFAHLDLVGTLMLLLAGFGWAKPVQVNEYALTQHSRSAPAWVALAGPASNLVLGFVGGMILASGLLPVPTQISQYLPSAYEVMYYFTLINFVLCFFNLIPLFPLDGEKIAVWFLPRDMADGVAKLRRFNFIPLIVVIWLLPRLGLPILEWLVFYPSDWLTRLFMGV